MARSSPPPAIASISDKIKWFLEHHPVPSTHENEATDTETPQAEDLDVEKLRIKDETPEEKVNGLIKDFLYIGGPDVLLSPKKEPQAKETKTQVQDAGSSS
jgi:hypothetical protein